MLINGREIEFGLSDEAMAKWKAKKQACIERGYHVDFRGIQASVSLGNEPSGGYSAYRYVTCEDCGQVYSRRKLDSERPIRFGEVR